MLYGLIIKYRGREIKSKKTMQGYLGEAGSLRGARVSIFFEITSLEED